MFYDGPMPFHGRRITHDASTVALIFCKKPKRHQNGPRIIYLKIIGIIYVQGRPELRFPQKRCRVIILKNSISAFPQDLNLNIPEQNRRGIES